MLLVDEWEYKCEGIGNLILTYTGDQQQYKRHVMRIRKKSEFEGDMSLHGTQHYVFMYMNKVMERLVGSAAVKSGQLVEVSREFLERINEKALPFRPSYRVSGEPIDLDSKVVMLLPDFTSIDDPTGATFAVEIKPKWGILCRSHLVDDSFKETKFAYCRYCMHQVLKRSDGKISKLSLFCPIDLYSTEKQRVIHSLTQLVHHPQNNFRVYVDSLLRWHNDMTKNENAEFSNLLEELLREKNFHGMSDQPGIIEEFVETIYRYLNHSRVLRYLQKVQLLDIYDVEIANKILSNLLSDYTLDELHKMLFPFHDEPALEKIMEEIDAELSMVDQDMLTRNYVCRRFRDHSEPISLLSSHTTFENDIVDQCVADEAKALHILRTFLIAQCAKDCSIMLAFSAEGDQERYELGVVDLDPKPVTKIPHYSKLDRTIVELFLANKHKI